MGNNIITATVSLIKNTRLELEEVYKSKTRVNSMGDALEEYILDLFADTFNIEDERERMEKQGEVFSYLGGKRNPPDAILKNGDAIEVKKIETKKSRLALNSSYPKNKLYKESPLITRACKEAEDGNWTEKDIIYVVGSAEKSRLNSLLFIYGEDYAANRETYEELASEISRKIKEIDNLSHGATNELGRINGVDPLKIADLRIRGMWTIKHPFDVFNYTYQLPEEKQFTSMCILNEEKWKGFTNTEESIKLANENDKVSIKDIKICDPNNRAITKDAKLITYEIEIDQEEEK